MAILADHGAAAAASARRLAFRKCFGRLAAPVTQTPESETAER
jgi:hypothetical protein